MASSLRDMWRLVVRLTWRDFGVVGVVRVDSVREERGGERKALVEE